MILDSSSSRTPDATPDQLKQWFEESGSDEGLIPG